MATTTNPAAEYGAGYDGPTDALAPNAGVRVKDYDAFHRTFEEQASALWFACPRKSRATLDVLGEALGCEFHGDAVRVVGDRAGYVASRWTGGTKDTRAVREAVAVAARRLGFRAISRTDREDLYATTGQRSLVKVQRRGSGKRQDLLVDVVVPFKSGDPGVRL